MHVLSGNSRPTTPVESDNSGSDTLGRGCSDGVLNGLDSHTAHNNLSAQPDIDNVIASIGNQIITPAASNITSNSTKMDSSSVVKKKNKRSKHTKSCEIDPDELEKALAIAEASAVAPVVSKVETLPSSAKKKGHRRVKSGNAPKLEMEPGDNRGTVQEYS